MATILLPALKAEGYHITAHVNKGGAEVIKHDPRVDKIVLHETNSIDIEQLGDYWELLSHHFDKFINLSGSIEDNLLIPAGSPKWRAWNKATRQANCDRNYYDETISWAGYDADNWSFGKNPVLHFTKAEHSWARRFRKKYKKKFIIMWALSGSSLHKSYPYTEYILRELLYEYEDIMVIFVGDMVCELLQFSHPRVKGYSGQWRIRRSLLMTGYVDCVVGPETGVLNAAAGHDTPKLIFLSHSTHKNLSEHWTNVTPLHSLVKCYPCHVLHYTLETCPIDSQLKTPICMTKLPAKAVYNALEEEYQKWATLN